MQEARLGPLLLYCRRWRFRQGLQHISSLPNAEAAKNAVENLLRDIIARDLPQGHETVAEVHGPEVLRQLLRHALLYPLQRLQADVMARIPLAEWRQSTAEPLLVAPARCAPQPPA